MKKLIILGTGGNCLEILDAVRAVNRANPRPLYECAGFLDDNRALHGQEFGGVRVLGPLAEAGRQAGCVFVNGIGSPANFWRKPEIIQTTGLVSERFETIIHPKADVSAFARLGRGCVLLAGAAVGAIERRTGRPSSPRACNRPSKSSPTICRKRNGSGSASVSARFSGFR